MAAGIVKRHSNGCRSQDGRGCSCRVGYEAWVYSPRDGRKLRRTFSNFAEARSWRADAKRQIDQGSLRAPSQLTLGEAAGVWLAGAEAGEIRSEKLSGITTSDLQVLVDRWQAEGHPASTLRNTIKPLQAIYRRAKSRGGLPVNPTRDLELPAPRPRQVEIVAPDIAAKLLTALPAEDPPVWATALYAGLRYGELRALRWGAVDVAGGAIEVRESWDAKAGKIEPKTRTSRRRVPMPAALRELILDRRLEDPTAPDRALVFGSGEDQPFHAATLYRRADAAWGAAGVVERLRLHQARHTYASFMIAAGVNAKALSQFMGHSSIKVTFDLDGHLMPGSEREAAGMLDAFLERASTQARIATVAS